MGQSAHPGRPAWVSALAAALLLGVAVVTTGCSHPLSAQTTVLRAPQAVTVVHTDGTSVAGSNGLRLRRGDVVRTGPAGRAELVTDTRTVYLGSGAALQVLDGARQALRAGAAVVNALHGPGLGLQVANLTVATPAGAAVRAERSVTVRIGSLAGASTLTSSTGRRLTVPALHQTIAGGDALPDTTTPLRLTDDDGEARTVPQLVRDDRTLLGLARGIDATGRSTVRVVTAALPNPLSGPLAAPAGVGRSERLLPALIAAAGPASGTQRRYDDAVDYRRAGGSWAVVARLVGVGASAVVTTLADFERNQPAGHVGTVAQVLAGVAGPSTSTGGDGGTRPSGSGSSGPTPTPTPSGSGPSSGPTPTPTPSPSSSGVVGVVDDTLGTVLSLLPTPSPTRTSAPALPLPLPGVTLPALPPLP